MASKTRDTPTFSAASNLPAPSTGFPAGLALLALAAVLGLTCLIAAAIAWSTGWSPSVELAMPLWVSEAQVWVSALFESKSAAAATDVPVAPVHQALSCGSGPFSSAPGALLELLDSTVTKTFAGSVAILGIGVAVVRQNFHLGGLLAIQAVGVLLMPSLLASIFCG